MNQKSKALSRRKFLGDAAAIGALGALGVGAVVSSCNRKPTYTAPVFPDISFLPGEFCPVTGDYFVCHLPLPRESYNAAVQRAERAGTVPAPAVSDVSGIFLIP